MQLKYQSLKENSPLITITEENFKMIISPFGGRIIHVDFGQNNLLWVHPKIESGKKINDWNIGGIRTWFSPERDLFYKNPTNFDNWYCPKNIDPLLFDIKSAEKKIVKLTTHVKLNNNLTNETMLGILTKKIELSFYEETDAEVKCEIKQKTEFLVESGYFPVNIWTLAQVKPGDKKGKVIINTKNLAEPIHYFSQIPENYLKKRNNSIEFLIDGLKELKLGISPSAFINPNTQNIKYYFKEDNRQYLIEMISRNSPINQSECLDVARNDPNKKKGSIQIYNSNKSDTGLRFGELETHSKPLKLVENKYQTFEDNSFIFTMIK